MMSDIEVKFLKMLIEKDGYNPWDDFTTYDEVVKKREKETEEK